jgi:hypothetical protein
MTVGSWHQAAQSERIGMSTARKPTLGRWTAIRVLTLKRHGGSELLLRKTDQRPYSARHDFLI